MPGYLPGTDYFGMQHYNNQMAPGWQFISGWQNESYAEQAFRRNMLTLDQNLNDCSGHRRFYFLTHLLSFHRPLTPA